MATETDAGAKVLVIPTNKIGMVIGSGGLTLRKIEAETGCTVTVRKWREEEKQEDEEARTRPTCHATLLLIDRSTAADHRQRPTNSLH